MKLSIILDTFPTRIMKRSVRRQPLRRIFVVLQLVEYHQSPSRSCGCSSNSWNTARPWISALPFCNVLSFCPDDKTILPSSLPKCFHISQIRMFQRFTVQFGTHMIRHRQTHWQQVIAVKNRWNIQFPVFCRNFCNICHALLQRYICCEITF